MLKFSTNAILEKLEDTKNYKTIAKKILDDSKINDENYELACQIFVETSIEYFHLGFKTCLDIIFEFREESLNTKRDES